MVRRLPDGADGDGVPMGLIEAVAHIRQYGTDKYGDADNWKTVEKERYIDAAWRHWVAFNKNNDSVDDESGFKHLWHMACNLAFLIEMDMQNEK